MKILNSKVKYIFIFFIGVFIFVPHIAHGGFTLFGLADVAYEAVSGVAYLISALIAVILGGFITFFAWIVGIILNINTDVVNSPFIKAGFPLVLNLANLGFVLGIIIIAIATILRNQTYGIKQILWKLIVMAILVNFGLILAGTILNFADQISIYFLDQMKPAGSANSYLGFADAIGEAFQPQRALTLSQKTTANDLGKASGSTISVLFELISSMLFSTVFLLMILVTLIALVVMLLIRYVWLNFLLVVLPFAWMFWVFPGLQKHWNSWWNHFLKQAFFAPIVLFFMWLAMQTATQIGLNKADGTSKIGNVNISLYQAPGNNLWGAIEGFFGGAITEMVVNSTQSLILVGLMVGGLIAANSLGMKFAGTAMNTAKSIGTWAQGAATRGAKKGIGAPFRGRGEQVRNWAQNRQNRLGKIAAGWLATGVTKVEKAGTKDLVSHWEKEYGNLSPEELQARRMTVVSADKKIAIDNLLMKAKRPGMIPADEVLTEETREAYKKLGQSDNFEKLEKALMMNVEMYKAIKNGESTQEELDHIAAEFFKKFTKKDANDMNPNDVFKEWKEGLRGLTKDQWEAMQKATSYGVASTAPALTPTIVAKLKSENLDNFQTSYISETRNGIKDLEKLFDSFSDVTRDELNEYFKLANKEDLNSAEESKLTTLKYKIKLSPAELNRLQNLKAAERKIKKIIANNAMSMAFEDVAPSPTPAPPPSGSTKT